MTHVRPRGVSPIVGLASATAWMAVALLTWRILDGWVRSGPSGHEPLRLVSAAVLIAGCLVAGCLAAVLPVRPNPPLVVASLAAGVAYAAIGSALLVQGHESASVIVAIALASAFVSSRSGERPGLPGGPRLAVSPSRSGERPRPAEESQLGSDQGRGRRLGGP